MIRLKGLNIALDIPNDQLHHNEDLVGYVIQHYPHKVCKANIITRNSIGSWYDDVTNQFKPAEKYTFLIGTVSLVGEVLSIADIPDNKSGKYSKQADPQAN